MPTAKRKTQSSVVLKPDAKPLPLEPPSGKRTNPAITKAQSDAMKQTAAAGDNVIERPGARARLVDWHNAVASVSGTLVVAFCKRGMGRDGAVAAIASLRSIADDMNKYLLD